MKVGDLVKRRSTGKVDIVTGVVLGSSLNHESCNGEWLRLAGRRGLIYASNYEVISESR